MRTLGNIIWHIPFLGFLNAIMTYLTGFILTITVVAAPIGLGLMEHGKFLFLPFSYKMADKKDLNIQQNKIWEAYSMIIMILYLPLGLLLACIAVLQMISLFISIIGIPVALVIYKSLGVYLNPVNKKCVPIVDN